MVAKNVTSQRITRTSWTAIRPLTQKKKPYKVLHTGVKPYKRPMCDVKSKSQPVLDEPKITKCSENPIACPVCSLKFSTLHEMAKHKLTHNKAEKLFYCRYKV